VFAISVDTAWASASPAVASTVPERRMSESLRCPVWGGFTARQVDTLAAYWVLVIVALHLGLHWLIVAGGILYSSFSTSGKACRSRIRSGTASSWWRPAASMEPCSGPMR